MMSLTEQAEMVEEEGTAGTFGRVAKIFAAVTGMIFCVGAIFGALAAHRDEGGGPLDLAMIGILAGFAGGIIGLAFITARLVRRQRVEAEILSGREKLNRNIVLACGLVGGVMGAVIAAAAIANTPDESVDPLSILFTGPMPVAIVLPLVFFWAVVMPVIAWFWHTRAIDEQEASAYRDGGYYAAYAYLILAPTWWLLWRGGLLPEPDGVAIFMTFSLIWSAVWFWKKYR